MLLLCYLFCTVTMSIAAACAIPLFIPSVVVDDGVLDKTYAGFLALSVGILWPLTGTIIPFGIAFSVLLGKVSSWAHHYYDVKSEAE